MGTVECVDPRLAEIRNIAPPNVYAPRKQRISEAASALFERIADVFAIMLAVVSAHSAYVLLQLGKHLHYSPFSVLVAAGSFAAVFVILLESDGAYKHANSLLRIRETERILRVSTQAFGIVFPITFFVSYTFSRWVFVLAAFLVLLFLIVEKQIVYLLIRQMHLHGYGMQNVLIYGAGSTGRRAYSALVRSPKLGMNPVAVVDDDKSITGELIYEFGYKRERSAPILAGPPTSILIRNLGVSLVVVGIPSITQEQLKRLSMVAFAAGAKVAFVPKLSIDSQMQTDYADIDGLLIASLNQPANKFAYEIIKRIFDFSAALVLLILTAPLWIFFAVLIKADSRGPVFFRQLRVGRWGKTFELYKFRTMRVDAPKYDFHPTGTNDPRITRVGGWLRRTSLDELPQLINILKGEMSLVGPRPEMPFIVETYNDQHRQRLEVLPGLTGLWQLSVDRAFLIHENIQYDLYYIRHRNLFMDVGILLHTLVFAMKGI